jgi:GDPmannose 4,6-dehydratase
MGKCAFVTGITGQDGALLAQFLLEKGYDVHGGLRRIGVIGTGRLDELGILDQITLHDFELLEMTNIQRVIDTIKPDEIYNLAAQSFVGASFELPIYTADVDGIGAMRLLEVVRSSASDCRFYQASTSEMYGKAQATPQSETTPFYPRSPYGVAKLFAHWSTVNYRESYGLRASSGILFNHESHLRGREFVTRKITLAFAQIAAGKQECLELGNLDAQRDWGYAGDYVKGMWQMLQQPQADDFVLATGITHSIRDFVKAAATFHGWDIQWSGEGIEEIGIDRKTDRVLIRINPGFYRPAEVDILCGDPSKAERELGWTRDVEFQGLVELMCESDCRRVGRKTSSF